MNNLTIFALLLVTLLACACAAPGGKDDGKGKGWDKDGGKAVNGGKAHYNSKSKYDGKNDKKYGGGKSDKKDIGKDYKGKLDGGKYGSNGGWSDKGKKIW